MQLIFDTSESDEEYRFRETRQQLCDEIDRWYAERHGPDEGETSMWSGTFMDWKAYYADGDLADVARGDVWEFLVEWCPRKVSGPPDLIHEIGRGLTGYVEFMHDTGRLRGGAGRAAEVITYIGDIAPEARAAMGDPSNFGTAKSVFSAPLTGDDGSPLADLAELFESGLDDDQLRAAVQERMDRFNALPFEDRAAITDSAILGPPETIDLDYVHVMPPSDEVDAAARSEMLRRVDALVEWLGPAGRQLTQAGHVRKADATELVVLLGTGDLDATADGAERSFTSSRDLPGLSMVVDFAQLVGAVDMLKTKVKPSPTWSDRATGERGVALAETLLSTGALATGEDSLGWFDGLREFVNRGLVSLLMGVLPPDSAEPIENAIDLALEVWSDSGEGSAGGLSAFEQRLMGTLVRESLDTCELFGMISIDGVETTIGHYGIPEYSGGQFTGTALLRHVLPDVAIELGYRFDRLDDLADVDAETFVAAVDAGAVEFDQALSQWQPDVPLGERIAQIARVAANTTDPADRLTVFEIFREIGAAPELGAAARELLDTPAAGHAALFLLDLGLATPDAVGSFLDLTPVVDMLWLQLDDPDSLADLFGMVAENAEGDVFEMLWRHDQPETLAVLEALGRVLPDKRAAKAARKAVMKHRSWLANRNRS